MTQKRLEELKTTFKNKQGTVNDLGELICDLFQSTSKHFNDIKNLLVTQNSNDEIIFQHLESIEKELNPVFSIIKIDEDD